MSANSYQANESDDNHAMEMTSEDSSQSDSEAECTPLGSLWKRLRTSMSISKFERTETKMFLPRDTFENILSGTAGGLSGRRKLVLEVMGIESSRTSEHDRALADYILQSAQKVFLIAVYIRLEQLNAAMELFKVSQFKDEHLPVEECTAQELEDSPKCHHFGRIESHQRSYRKKVGKRKMQRIWDMEAISKFQDSQWIFLTPTISAHDQNCNFDNRCPIPFITKNTQQSSGAHGIVHKYTIHPAHFENSLRQYDTEPSVVAVKAFRKGGKNVAVDVKREVDALLKMNELGEKHIVRFITSFQRGTPADLEYYVLFEWADGGNLSDFWTQHEKTRRTASLVQWVIGQLCGLAKALSAAHYMPDKVSYRHGDLKPGNILWFRENNGYGTLKIGDWGEAKSHKQVTALRHGRLDTTAKYGTRRYEPPETGLQSLLPKGTPHVRSRLYDVWGMGCIILEFIIWLLYDHKELCRFNNSNQGYFGLSDMFYEISHERVPRIHRVAEHWMEHMAKDGLCLPGETALGNLLQIVRTGLLIVELPEDGGLVPSADNGMPTFPHDDSPLISVTTPDSTNHEIIHGSSSNTRTRFRASELETELLRIALVGGGEHYWYQNQKPRPAPGDIIGMPHLPVPTGHREYSDVLPVPAIDMVDYAHPSLDPEEWEFELDNDFAATESSRLKSITRMAPHETPPSAKLCTICRDFQGRLLDAEFAISYATQTLRINSEAKSCDLCYILWQNCRDKLNGGCESVHLQRAGSAIRIRGLKHPILTVLRSDAVGGRAHDIQIGFPELSGAGTNLHLRLIRGWLDDCDNKHFEPVCKPPGDTKLATNTNIRLPTRLIHVGSDGDHDVKLQEMHGRTGNIGDWIALSYRWGDSPPFSTTRLNLTRHIKGMALSALPCTFQDAIKVTRALGKEYLWIDSICIVQGEDGDFSSESKRMEDVYSGAYCVLAASCATDQRSGFLLPRAKREHVALNCEKDGSVDTIYICSTIEDFRGHVLQGALHRRGWVLQEHALARRTVFFTEHQTYWECGHGVRCETMVKMKNESAALLGDPDFPRIFDPAKYGERILRFQELYRQYSRLDLSADYDRPAAIGGLQQRLLRTMGVRGGFGILDDPDKSGFLHRSLLWHRGEDFKQLKPIAFPSDRERVPSWSWMSVSGGIDYFALTWRKYDWQVIQPPWSPSPVRAPNAFHGTAQVFDITAAKVNEDDVIFDNTLDSEVLHSMAIVLGIEKGSMEIEDKKHYILVVRPKAIPHADGTVLYERVGAGYIPGRCLRGETRSCTLV